ncbi:bifunctional helix-turn-helix transcriptional regulator/GNAT family N-acetyltransferase [Propionispira raffinosivorans]|uniref:bifunctional helix-turn-helix transcriptional regulator/GNAT family N-acetyltransferase n=1 Tax=Propionispira raffinosivorans TaxID=86959 RepID=UPI000367DE28|nr:helix-turn-helix domain-containing GNAT family N-acetyltransferase [Propionispira raffinosivorans]
MIKDIEKLALEVRNFNRFYTNIIGIIDQTILDSPYSLAEARILLEIDIADQCTASDLTKLMKIDPGYLSRILLKFIQEKLVIKSKSSTDGRAQVLSLTDKGRHTIHKLYDDSTIQASKILEKLTDEEQQNLISHMVAIRNIMDKQQNKTFIIRTLKPGEAGYIAYRHCVLYEKEYGLGGTFERYVLDSLTKYIDEQPEGEVWVAEHSRQIVGSIAIVRSNESTAQLRWFLIEPEYRGTGLGRQLMTIAMDYCKQKKFSRVYLWTFQDLMAARHLYKSFGFISTEQVESNTWKNILVEERWDIVFSD